MGGESAFELVKKHCRETALLEATSALLQWDERTGLPAEAGGYRAEQITLLAGMIHARNTDTAYSDALHAASDSEYARADATVAACVAKLLKKLRRQTQLPLELVQAISKATVLGQQAWDRARREDNWSLFEPVMEEVFRLRREEASILATDDSPSSLYDVLLDEYEDGAKSADLTVAFADLRVKLVALVKQIAGSKNGPTGEAFRRPVEIDRQREISHWVCEKIGFSFTRGRLDETSHPFCTTLGPDDCRILTRYDHKFTASGLFGSLHEAGHGTYEQGLPKEWFGLPPGQAAGLGLHESQSRLWENFVGRSRPFWDWAAPEVASLAGGAWDGLSAEQIYRDANLVEPSLIRVEADEVTYNLHILIRFELEQELLSGELAVADAPQAWDDRYQEYLGVQAPSAADGILQDVHWSAGLVGYFPTYALGNLYAAQLMQSADADLGGVEALIRRGEFEPLLTWMQQNVHKLGGAKTSAEVVELATGQKCSADALVSYLRGKLEPIYAL